MKIHMILLFLFVASVISVELQQQTLDQQPKDHLNPSLDSETEHIAKDQDKRTIFGPQPHIYIGKHVGIHPAGYKYLLGYGPLDVRYKSPVKHYKVFKPVPVKVHYHSKPVVHLKPIAPVRQYLPVHVHSGWKHALKPAKPVVPVFPVQPPFISLLPPKPEPVLSLPPPVAPAPVPIVPIPPAPAVPAPALPGPAPVVPIPAPEPPSHYHFAFQTPVSRPVFVPQFHHVVKPDLGVLPLGASFPAPILPPPTPVAHPVALPAPHPLPVLPPPVPVPHQHIPVPQPLPVHHHPAVYPPHPHPHHHIEPAGPPVAFPAPAPPSFPHSVFPFPEEAHFPSSVPQPIPRVPDVPPPSLIPNYEQRPLFVEFHGIPSLNPLNKSIPPPAGSPVPQPAGPPFPQSGHELPTPSLGPPNVQQYHQQLQEQNFHSQGYHYQGDHGYSYSHGDPNQEYEPIGPNIQPGQTDLQFPLHLPEHPLYRTQEQGQQQFDQQQHLSPYHTITYQTHGNLDSFRSPINHHQNPIQRKGDEEEEEEDSSREVRNHKPPFTPSQRLLTPIDRSDEVDDEGER